MDKTMILPMILLAGCVLFVAATMPGMLLLAVGAGIACAIL